MILYTYWRSSASYRVRIAMALKGVSCEERTVHLVADGGEQHLPAYRKENPNGTVPTLVLADGTAITQSMAIIEYLDETHPTPPLLPNERVKRAVVRSAAQLIACDIHPIQNLRVVQHLKGALGHSGSDAIEWMNHWMRVGFLAYLDSIEPDSRFSFGDQPSLADLMLVPQLYNAKRWKMDRSGLERLFDIDAACLELAAFSTTGPDAQPEASES